MLRELIRQKHGAWNAWKRSSNPLHLSAFKNLRIKVTSALRAAEKQFLQTLHREMNIPHRSDSTKSFWRYIKEVSGKVKASSIPDLVIPEGDSSEQRISSDSKKASVLNSYFAQQTQLQNCPASFPKLPTPSQLSPDHFSTTPSEVYDVLSGLKPGKGAWSRWNTISPFAPLCQGNFLQFVFTF